MLYIATLQIEQLLAIQINSYSNNATQRSAFLIQLLRLEMKETSRDAYAHV